MVMLVLHMFQVTPSPTALPAPPTAGSPHPPRLCNAPLPGAIDARPAAADGVVAAGFAHDRPDGEMMSLLDTVNQPDDLRRFTHEQLRLLAGEIRAFLVEAICRRGGHLGPNLGVVELTIALHRVFRSPHDRIIFDTGHQAYVHKLLTGRRDGFAQLRGPGGLSGYPRRAESAHDLVENSHASTALSYAIGLGRRTPWTAPTARWSR